MELGVKAQRDLLVKFKRISAKFAEPMSDDEMSALIEEHGKVQERIDALDLWNPHQPPAHTPGLRPVGGEGLTPAPPSGSRMG